MSFCEVCRLGNGEIFAAVQCLIRRRYMNRDSLLTEYVIYVLVRGRDIGDFQLQHGTLFLMEVGHHFEA